MLKARLENVYQTELDLKTCKKNYRIQKQIAYACIM